MLIIFLLQVGIVYNNEIQLLKDGILNDMLTTVNQAKVKMVLCTCSKFEFGYPKKRIIMDCCFEQSNQIMCQSIRLTFLSRLMLSCQVLLFRGANEHWVSLKYRFSISGLPLRTLTTSSATISSSVACFRRTRNCRRTRFPVLEQAKKKKKITFNFKMFNVQLRFKFF